MPLKLVKRPKTPNWIMRGTVRGQSIEESSGTSDLKTAEFIRAKREMELLNESVYGKEFSKAFAHAALDYMEQGGEKRFVKKLLLYFKDFPLRTIGQEEIDKAAKVLFPNRSPATLNRQVYGPMAAILNHAAANKWCVSPVLKRPEVKDKPIRPLKPHEAENLISCCADHLRPLVVFMFYTGARAGEALWLDWKSIDLELKQVTFTKTKNGEARSVPLHPRVIEELGKVNNREGRVFLTNTLEPYTLPDPKKDNDTSAGSRIKTAFKGACRRAGIANFTPHCCRHTWATWHYQKNRDLTALQKLGGWKSVEMVLRYAHTNVSEHAQSIDNLPWGKSGEKPLLKVVS